MATDAAPPVLPLRPDHLAVVLAAHQDMGHGRRVFLFLLNVRDRTARSNGFQLCFQIRDGFGQRGILLVLGGEVIVEDCLLLLCGAILSCSCQNHLQGRVVGNGLNLGSGQAFEHKS